MMLGSQCSPCCGPSGGCINMAALFSEAVAGSPAPFSWYFNDLNGYNYSKTPLWQVSSGGGEVFDYQSWPDGSSLIIQFSEAAANAWQVQAVFSPASSGQLYGLSLYFYCVQDGAYITTPQSRLDVDAEVYRRAGGVCVRSPGSVRADCLENDGVGYPREFGGNFVSWGNFDSRYLGISFTDSRWYLRNPLP